MAKKLQSPDDIFLAAGRNDVHALERFLAARPDLSAVDEYGFTALHRAVCGDTCGNSAFEAMKLLVEAGSPINQPTQDDTARTPLYLAAEFSQALEPVKYLVEHGADPKIPSAHKVSIVQNAWSEDVQKYLSELTGFALPEPPPLPKYPERKISAAQWKTQIAPVLKSAFAALNKAGIYAMHSTGSTQDDGLADCFERLQARKDAARFTAYAFYTTMDRTRARDTGVLALGWGITHDDESRIEKSGAEIVRVLSENGLDVEWAGTRDARILIYLQPLF